MSESTLQRIERVFHEVFEGEDFEFSPSLSREDLEAWDSLGHIRLVASLEAEFGSSLSLTEVEQLQSVNDVLRRFSGNG
jgi:acyl carrier protein